MSLINKDLSFDKSLFIKLFTFYGSCWYSFLSTCFFFLLINFNVSTFISTCICYSIMCAFLDSLPAGLGARLIPYPGISEIYNYAGKRNFLWSNSRRKNHENST